MTTSPPNPHLSDPSLRPFLAPTFSPIDYLNTHLPSLNTPPTTTKPPSSSNLSTLASQTSSTISALSAQQSRLSTTLTALTDEILRTSSRLAYEVELLRGEAVALGEALGESGVLHDAIQRIIPGGLPAKAEQNNGETKEEEEEGVRGDDEPAALPRLRTLHTVRAQLQRVIQTFNLALAFPLPPSMLAGTASSLINIQSPNADPDAEVKGQQALGKLKGDVLDLLRGGDVVGARGKVEELRGVCVVWKGTGEERARGRWVDGLEQLVEGKEEEERERRIGREQRVGQGRREESAGGGVRQTPSGEKGAKEGGTTGGGGFLRRLRDEIYLD